MVLKRIIEKNTEKEQDGFERRQNTCHAVTTVLLFFAWIFDS